MTLRPCIYSLLLLCCLSSLCHLSTYGQDPTSRPGQKDTTRVDTLRAARVTAIRPAVTTYTDKIVVNVQNSIVSAGGSALDILANTPGVTVDNSDNVQIRGRQGVLFQLDGHTVQITPSELALLLKGMPASSIDKIEIITQPSARYDAAGNAGIINIRLRKDEHTGTNGTLTLNAGQGKYPKAGGGFSLNSHHKGLNLYISYNYSYREMFNHLVIDRRFYDSSHYTGGDQQDNYFKYRYNTHLFKGGLDYVITPKTTLSFAATGLTNVYTIRADNVSDEKDAAFNTVGIYHLQMLSSNHPGNYSATLSLRHTPDTLGTILDIDMDYARYNDRKLESFSDSVSDRQQGQLDIYSVRADYNTPLSHTITGSAGIKSSIVQSQHFLDFNSFTSQYRYHENINALYAEAIMNLTHWRMDLGLRMENTNNDSSWLQLFPSLNLTRKLAHQQEFTFFANRRTDRPNYNQLSPLRLYIDATTYKVGNPDLLPQLTDAAGFTYNFSNRIITTLTYSITHHTMRTVFIPDSARPGVTYQTDKNLDSYKYLGLTTAVNYTLTSWWSTANNLVAYYSYIHADLLHSALDKGNTAFQLTTSNKFALTNIYKAELTAVYNSSFLDAYIYNYPTFNLSIGIQRSILQSRGTLRINLTDAFYSSYLHANSYIDDLSEAFSSKRESRVLNLSFSYSFGRSSVQQTKVRGGGAEEEKQRAN